jgi:hypothetical protein
VLGGYEALIACLLVIAATELAVSATAQRHATGTRQPVNEIGRRTSNDHYERHHQYSRRAGA